MKIKLARLKNKFPRISRRITEKEAWIVVVSVLMAIAILTVGADLQRNIQKKQNLEKESVEITRKIEYWVKTIEKYKDFRDAYFQLAVLNYQLGNFEKAKDYVQKVFELDPNFKEARELEKMLR